eukprot:3982014-Pleurochrysis_carterae.AAC.3
MRKKAACCAGWLFATATHGELPLSWFKALSLDRRNGARSTAIRAGGHAAAASAHLHAARGAGNSHYTRHDEHDSSQLFAWLRGQLGGTD